MYKSLFPLFLLTALSQAQITSPVTGVGNFIHNVADLDKSLAFYHDVLGMDLQGAPVTGPRPFVATPEILLLYDAPGAQFRVAGAQVPLAPMRAELVEFKNIEHTPVRPRIQDPGASIFVLTVRDLAPIVARIKSSSTPVVTTGGGPVGLGNGAKGILVQDPDGFFVELIQYNPQPATRVPAGNNLIDVGFAFTVTDADRMAQVFRQGLAFAPTTGDFRKDVKLFGLRDAQVRRTSAPVPGTNFAVEFLEFKGVDRKPVQSRLRDPGSGVLRLVVNNAGAAVKMLNAAGVQVASTNGQLVKLPGTNPNLQAAIASAPDNLFVQILQTAAPQ